MPTTPPSSADIDSNDTNTDGNFIAETTADIQGSNSWHIVTGGGTDSTARLDGFTITAGLNTGNSATPNGTGMYNVSSSPTLANLTFSGNKAVSGGAMYNNTGSGAIYTLDAGPTLNAVSTTPAIDYPVGITVDPKNADLLVADQTTKKIIRVNPTTGATSDVVSGFARLYWGGVDISPDGNTLVVSDYDGDAVYVFSYTAPTAATLTRFDADAGKKGVRVKWETGSELQVIGFNVWRKKADGRWQIANGEFIAAKTPGAVTGSAYAFTDKKVKIGSNKKHFAMTSCTLGNTLSCARFPHAVGQSPLTTGQHGTQNKRKFPVTRHPSLSLSRSTQCQHKKPPSAAL
ncbi:MAG: hypothetical protein HY741_27775 [Chloroflexi bacterium]|nr:hypothetical protein [Chloroflexota bacterium]